MPSLSIWKEVGKKREINEFGLKNGKQRRQLDHAYFSICFIDMLQRRDLSLALTKPRYELEDQGRTLIPCLVTT